MSTEAEHGVILKGYSKQNISSCEEKIEENAKFKEVELARAKGIILEAQQDSFMESNEATATQPAIDKPVEVQVPEVVMTAVETEREASKEYSVAEINEASPHLRDSYEVPGIEPEPEEEEQLNLRVRGKKRKITTDNTSPPTFEEASTIVCFLLTHCSYLHVVFF